MARRFTFTCDGCEREISSGSPDLPQSWADVTTTIEGLTNWRSGGGARKLFIRLLCGNCQIVLVERADPKEWVRDQEAAR